MLNMSDIQELRSAIRSFEQLRAQQVRLSTLCIGVTSARCQTLLALYEIMPCSLNTLAETLCLEKSTVSRTVECLVRSELVCRTNNPENRREAQLSLSTEGVTMVRRINKDNNHLFRQVFSNMTPEDAKKFVSVFRSFNESLKIQLEAMKKTRTGATVSSPGGSTETVD